MESVTVVTEPLLHRDFVQFEIVVPILERLRGKYDITLAAPKVAPAVKEELESKGIAVADGGVFFPPIRRSRDEIPSYVVSWMRDAIWGWNRRDIERVLKGRDGARINASMTVAIDSDVWLIQSRPLGQGVDAMRHSVSRPLSLAMTAALPFIRGLDHHHILDTGRRAGIRYSTTQHVGNWFGTQGLPVAGVLPMYYRSTISRSTRNPSRDYLLVYVGKETDTAAVRMLLDTGLPVTMFGSKSVGWVMSSLKLERYPHARLLGYVTDAELKELYSNARFTAFPFTEEPFGLVPLESMACGTPILTYGEQGPGETVLDGRTGWLVHSREEFVRRAVELWNHGAPPEWMVEQCLARARGYHIDTVSAGWKMLFESSLARREAGKPAGRPVAPPWTVPAMDVAVASPTVTRAYAVGPEHLSSPPDAIPALIPMEMPEPPDVYFEFWRSGGRRGLLEPEIGTLSGPPMVEFEDESGLDADESSPLRRGRDAARVPEESPQRPAPTAP